eukprot:14948674-Heterocapsa_arctica.AAC.1
MCCPVADPSGLSGVSVNLEPVCVSSSPTCLTIAGKQQISSPLHVNSIRMLTDCFCSASEGDTLVALSGLRAHLPPAPPSATSYRPH